MRGLKAVVLTRRGRMMSLFAATAAAVLTSNALGAAEKGPCSERTKAKSEGSVTCSYVILLPLIPGKCQGSLKKSIAIKGCDNSDETDCVYKSKAAYTKYDADTEKGCKKDAECQPGTLTTSKSTVSTCGG